MHWAPWRWSSHSSLICRSRHAQRRQCSWWTSCKLAARRAQAHPLRHKCWSSEPRRSGESGASRFWSSSAEASIGRPSSLACSDRSAAATCGAARGNPSCAGSWESSFQSNFGSSTVAKQRVVSCRSEEGTDSSCRRLCLKVNFLGKIVVSWRAERFGGSRSDATNLVGRRLTRGMGVCT